MRPIRLATRLGSAKHSVLSSWLLSYIVLLLLPTALSVGVYVMGQRAVEGEVGRLNTAILNQIRIAGDAGLQDIRRTVYQISADRNLAIFINSSISYRDLDPYTMVAVHRELGRVKLVSEYAEAILIYVRNIDMVLTLDALIEPRQQYERDYQGVIGVQEEDYDAWYQELRSVHHAECIPVLRIYEGDEVRHRVIYMQSLPLDAADPADATIVVTISTSRFERILQNIHSIGGGQALIVDGSNRILFTTQGPYDRPCPVDYAALTGKAGSVRAQADGESAVVSFVDSGLSDWKYVSIVPARTFWERARRVRTASLLCLGLCILLGGGAAWMFARRNYAPVVRLVRLMEQQVGAQPWRLAESDEYGFLQKAMGSVLSENEKIRQRLVRQDAALRRSFLAGLLTGSEAQDPDHVAAAVSSYGIRFESELFAVLLLYIADLAPEPAEQGGLSGLTRSRLMVADTVEEVVRKESLGYATEVDEMVACLVNASRGKSCEEACREAQRAAVAVRQAVRERLGIELRVSTSSIHEGILGVPDAYREALGVMEYKVAMEDDEALSPDDIRTSGDEYGYSIADEQYLMNYVKSGDYDAAAAVIDRVFESRFVRTAMSIDLTKCLVFDVVGTIVRTLPEVCAPADEQFVRGLRVFDRLASCVMVQDMKREIKDILRSVCAHVQEHHRSRKDELGSQIVAFVKERLGDSTLSVSSVADRFRLSAAYVTRVFREQAGQGLFEYISGLRMERAKELLRARELSIKEVAASVGYLESGVFIRAFRKHEGVTPGTYRESTGAPGSPDRPLRVSGSR